MIVMKRKHILSLMLIAMSAVLTACSTSDEEPDLSDSTNKNANTVLADGDKAVTRLEFPRLKGDNSMVIVHRTSDYIYDKDGVNFATEWDKDKKSQRWSCYIMTSKYDNKNLVSRYYAPYDKSNPDNIISKYTGKEQYPKDPQLDDKYYWDRDYIYSSGFEHGHICPSNDRQKTTTMNYQTFFLTNMQPQYHAFNGYEKNGPSGLWLRMENVVRNNRPSSATDTLFVCKGGTIDKESDILKRIDGKVIVPKYFFMALLLKYKSGDKFKYRAIGWIAPQDNQYHADIELKKYAVSIDRLEELTGIDFFCNLPDEIEDYAEKQTGVLSWAFDKE